MHIVLIEPEIPGNTGNIARLCAVSGMELHLVKPLGFSVEDKYLKRAGLDYWRLVKVNYHEDFSPRSYDSVSYTEDDLLVFGKETAGLPEKLLEEHWEDCIRIPMRPGARSLNLSSAAAIVAYEAMRQIGFPGLDSSGHWHGN